MREFYNEDCMQGMGRYPDKFFDLAIVDPPYGTGNTLDERGGWNRFGQRFDRYKHPLPKKERQEAGRDMGLCELEEPGRQRMQKNYFVGCGAGTGLFQGTVSHLTEPDYLGRQLFRFTTDKMFSCLA